MKTEAFIVVETTNEDRMSAGVFDGASVVYLSVVYLSLECDTIPWAGHAILVYARKRDLTISKYEKLFERSSFAKAKTLSGKTIIAFKTSSIIVELQPDTL